MLVGCLLVDVVFLLVALVAVGSWLLVGWWLPVWLQDCGLRLVVCCFGCCLVLLLDFDYW